MARIFNASLQFCAIAGLAVCLNGPAAAQIHSVREPHGERLNLSAFSGPIDSTLLFRLPVRFGGTSTYARIEDFLIKENGRISRVVVSDGYFLRMGVNGKPVALPYDAASVEGTDGVASFFNLNVASNYGEVIREFRSQLISPSDYSMKAITGASVSTVDRQSAGTVRSLLVNEYGYVVAVMVDISGRSVRIPFSDLKVRRNGPSDDTRLFTSLTFLQLSSRR